MSFVCLDLETTGLSPESDHVIEVAIVHFDENGIQQEWSSLVKPPIRIPEFTTRLTGITNEMVADAPTLDELHDLIEEKLGDHPIMGHFIFFDVNFLNHHGFSLENTQLDTCQFIQVLLPNEPSYSLEVFTTKLGITQEDAHRAMDDVKANIEFYFHMADHVRALSQEEKAGLKPLLQKSGWSWASVILPLLEESATKRIPATERTMDIQSEEHVDLAVLTAQLETPFLLEEPSHTVQDLINYAKTLDGRVLLVVPNLDLVPDDSELGTLRHPSEYLDEKRLDNYVNKERLNPIETMLASKLTLWLNHTQTGEKNDLRIVKDEKQDWFDVCCQESAQPQSFFAKAFHSDKKITVVDHYYFLKDRARKDPLLKDFDQTLVMQTEAFPKRIEDAWHIILSESRFLGELRRLKTENPDSTEVLDHIAGRVSILFGFLGMEIQRYGQPGDTRHTLIVEAHHRNTPEWNKVMQAAASIQAALAALGDDVRHTPTRDELDRYLGYLSKILQDNDPILWMTASEDGQVIIHSFPEETARLFAERVWPKPETLHLFCHHGDLSDDFAFLRQELGFPEATSFTQIEHTRTLPYSGPRSEIVSPKDPANIAQVCRELGMQVTDVQGNVYLLVTARHSCEKFFYELPKHLPEDRKLFVQNMNGSLGKIQRMSAETDGQNIFVGTESLMNFLLNEGTQLDFLAIHRVPFGHPNDPIQKARSSLHKSAYLGFSLPMAKLRLHNIMGRFLGNNWDGKSILGLDPRIERDDFI